VGLFVFLLLSFPVGASSTQLRRLLLHDEPRSLIQALVELLCMDVGQG